MADQLHVVLHPVREDRGEGYERFLAEVVTPAVRAERPDLDGRWRVLRSAPDDGVVTYTFLLDGGSLTDDWGLGPLLAARFGEDEAERLLDEWTQTFSSLREWAETAAARGQESNQLAVTLEPVELTTGMSPA